MIRTVKAAVLLSVLTLGGIPAIGQPPPSKQLMKTVLGSCYEVDPDFLPVIDQAVKNLREQMRSHGQGKLVAYISVPLTARGGGYRPVNIEISDFLKSRLESRFAGKLWALAPGKAESELPKVNGKSAAGGEYMYMWTQVLAGEDGFGKDFNLLFSAGPAEMTSFFGPGTSVIGDLEKYIDTHSKTDPDFKRQIADDPKARTRFIAYYSTKASATFSDGSHDEWNIFVEINRRRRGDPSFGLGEQIPFFFDGKAVNPGDMETKVSPGYEKTCSQ